MTCIIDILKKPEKWRKNLANESYKITVYNKDQFEYDEDV